MRKLEGEKWKSFERHLYLRAKDFAHFVDLAKGSCGEVRSMLYVAEDLKYLKPEEASILRNSAEMLSRGIAAFTNHLRS